MTGSTRVTVVGRDGCHLCERALTAAIEVAGPAGVASLDVDGELGEHVGHRAEWSELVPVILVDGRVHDVLRVDPARLGAALRRKPGSLRRPG